MSSSCSVQTVYSVQNGIPEFPFVRTWWMSVDGRAAASGTTRTRAHALRTTGALAQMMRASVIMCQAFDISVIE